MKLMQDTKVDHQKESSLHVLSPLHNIAYHTFYHINQQTHFKNMLLAQYKTLQ